MAAIRKRRERLTEPRKAPTQGRARVTIDAILEATAHILRDRGWDRLTTNHVAARAGVSIGSVYQYFPSKEALVAALVDRHLDRLTAVVTTELARAADLPLEEALRRILGGLVRAQTIDPDLNRAVMEQLPRVGRLARVRTIDADFEALVRAALDARARDLARKDTRLAAFLLVQTAKWVTMAALLEHPEYLRGDKLAKELATMFARYVTK